MISLAKLPIDLAAYDWAAYFSQNACRPLSLDFSEEIPLSKREQALVFPSIRAFALGESSDGHFLLRCVGNAKVISRSPSALPARESLPEPQKNLRYF